jgi:hypothetical protein
MRKARAQGRAIATALGASVLVMALVPPVPAMASVNLIVNSGLEAVKDGMPVCWERSGYGNNDFVFEITDQAHSGDVAMSVTLASRTDGDRKAMMLESASCAPSVIPGHQYDLSVWYTTTTPDTVITMFRHDVALGWQYWMDLAHLSVTDTFERKTVRTPPVPPNTDQITWGVTIYGVGTLVTDDYSMVDVTLPTEGDVCSAGDACVEGYWDVLPFDAPARAMHAVVLHNGNVLFIAGSGNSEELFNAGEFRTALYQPYTGTFIDVPTPADLFCAGHVQLPDGRVLVMGGNKNYPAPDYSIGYGGLRDSYIYDPATNAYQQINDMIAGHWYPSATILGNGDVISLGGLGEDSGGIVIAEYFDYSEQRWLSFPETNQNWAFWGLYPAMILMQDGRLFYTGSHVFGPGLDGTGASIYDYESGSIVDVPGLQRKDERDQSMSVLLPPAQDQRVLTVGGSLPEINPDANRLVDIIDLKQPNPMYVPGPLLPTGYLDGGVPQTEEQGKKYVSLVILPDGTVFESGGGMHTQASPVYGASVFDPVTNTWTKMAPNPTAHTYHSVSFLLPDGRVMIMGNNKADGSYDTHMSVYSPPYLFKGPRPQITSIDNREWSYGSTQEITVDTPIVKASLIRPAAVTHSSDPNQRYVELPLSVAGNTIGLNVTSNPNIAPPGWYMLFVVNANGTPSVAEWVHLT